MTHDSSYQADEYCCLVNLNLYDSPSCQGLATQAAVGRHLQIVSKNSVEEALEVRLCEDGYCAWLPVQEFAGLEQAQTRYRAIALSPEQIQERIPAIIAFTKAAMQQPNYYLWGGTVGPNYDCSGLIQAAFAASGIWLPRDSYQQADFTHEIEFKELRTGDLVFFAKAERVSHVGLHLGDGYYIHSSGQETGRNGIAVDCLSEDGDEIARSYFRQFFKAGRVVASYQNRD
ncbi:C40 family peptidase [Allocoleopsis franciscana]|uniref:Cell wall-associated hydrolase, invasion-associated protein n=1 Tax=Allocoleopsis franciscana PCC 7113 TaxID=1173027 RepID=K9WFG8_9CYAN|nr:C40 family peptidase [Allocoleopsis franciscana]AFZ19130.1 cell wall-associated hydrolase, invasion-associated protein [Allocoleopsis franciscana PCC 7113]